MTPEVLLQRDMFTGELVDTRTRKQRQRDRAVDLPRQTEMFAQGELAQFGVSAHPQIPLSSDTKRILVSEDPRTQEERERDRERQAETLTAPIFGEKRDP